MSTSTKRESKKSVATSASLVPTNNGVEENTSSTQTALSTRVLGPNGGPQPYWNPYLCGVLLGLVLLASYVILGTGLGASSAPARFVAQLEQWIVPAHVSASEYFGPWGEQPLSYYLVYMFVGTFVGGLFSAVLARRVHCEIERGRAFNVGPRLLLALGGGVLAGFASRLARGCTSGQALSGGALLLSGSLVFMACMFVSGFATAYLFRRQWHD